jgi:GT2 family glycosyltransferase
MVRNNFKDIKCHPKLSLNIIKMSDKSKTKIEEEPSVSIIIAFQKPGDYLRKSLAAIEKLHYQNYEVILLPDEPMKSTGEGITVIPTGPIGPPMKRDIGAREAKGEIIAFIDDDAYPREDWLKNAVRDFSDDTIAAIGGPASTAPSDDFWQKTGGDVLSGWMVGGVHLYRMLPKERREVDDYPTCNLLVRRSTFEEVGGFDSPYWPGEDTILCWKLTHQAKKKIIYDPDVQVFHHRRPLFRKHWKQIGNYGLHRGYFVKKFPKTSRRFNYFLPSLWTVFLLLGWLPLLLIPGGIIFYGIIVLLYLLAAVLTGVRSLNFKTTVIVAAGIVSTHIVYGFNFIRGLLVKKLPEE